jgi:ferredoxin, 2Fe-2S
VPTIKITVLPENKVIEVDPATMPYHEHGKKGSLLDILMHHHVNLEHACGGSCACTTCHVIVKSGEEHLAEAEDDELDKLDMAPGLTLHSRLGCQAVPKGDVTIEIPSWNINYVSEGGGSMNLGSAIPPPKPTK